MAKPRAILTEVASYQAMPDTVERLKAALADRYAIERELGAGGMAIVYLAEDLKHHRKVAIKVLRPELAAVLGSERFLREIDITANLNHPHVLPLLDSGDADGFLYYVMPYFEGESLRDRLNREQQLPVADALQITGQVAAALSYAHRHAVIHRDIKPENILLHEGNAVVADFGIAVSAALGERLTQTGLSLGTPAYMSPEQVSGDRELDGRSDVYSLACVLYEMLAGDPPFMGSTAQAVMARHVTDGAPPITTVRPSIGAAAGAAIAKALGKSPADRFTTASQFIEALERSTGPTVTVQPATKSTSSTVRRYAAVGLVVALGAFGLVSVTRSPSTDEPIRFLVKPFDFIGTEDDAYLAATFAAELRGHLSRVPAINVVPRETSRRAADAGWSALQMGDSSGIDIDYVLDATVRVLRTNDGEGRLHVATELVNTADGMITGSWDFDTTVSGMAATSPWIAGQILDDLEMASGQSDSELIAHRDPVDPGAYQSYQKGEFYLSQLTLEGMDRALEHFREAIARDPLWAPAHVGLAKVYMALGGWFGALPSMEVRAQAKAEIAEALALDSTLAEAHMAQGNMKARLEYDWAAADGAFRRGLALDPTSTLSRLQYANYLSAMGRFDESIALGRQTLDADPLSPAAYLELGAALQFAGRYDEALELYQEALALEPSRLQAHLLLMVLYGDMGRIEEALAEAPLVAQPSARTFVANLYGLAGRRADELDILNELAQRAETTYVSPVVLARVHIGLGDTEQALKYLERAYAERDNALVFLREFDLKHYFSSLRSHPRFRDLMRRMNFPAR